MRMITRQLNIKNYLEPGKVLVIYGPRQVGKTTLVRTFLDETDLSYKAFTADDIDFANKFAQCDLRLIKSILGDARLLFIDEAQKIENVGRALKLLVDQLPDIYVVITGSSSFDLVNSAAEPLTGRKNVLTLYPVSINEFRSVHTWYEIQKHLSEYLIYGTYPAIVTAGSEELKQHKLIEIKDSYLTKDILEFDRVKQAKPLIDLLKLLAFQVGSEVSTVELGTMLGVSNKTVTRYLDLLGKSFVIFRLDGFSGNRRKEIRKMGKYYFYDLGIRNALIANFNDLDTRNDEGQLWENFMIVERLKANVYKKVHANYYFWRTYDGQEVDLVEERNGRLHGYEIKWRRTRKKPPKQWLNNYENASYETVTSEDYQRFVRDKDA